MKRPVCIPILCLCASFLLGSAPPLRPNQVYLDDVTGVLSQADGDAVIQNASRLFEDTGVEMTLVCLEDLGGEEPAAYMEDIVEGWSLGGELGDSYVLMLFSNRDKMVWITVGSRIRSDLTPHMLQDEIADAVILPYIRQGDYSKALREGQRALVLAVYNAFGSKPGEKIPDSEKTVDSEKEKQAMRAIVIVGSMVIIIRSFYVTHKARARYDKLYGKGSIGKRKRFARQIADIEYTYQDEQDSPAKSGEDDNA